MQKKYVTLMEPSKRMERCYQSCSVVAKCTCTHKFLPHRVTFSTDLLEDNSHLSLLDATLGVFTLR